MAAVARIAASPLHRPRWIGRLGQWKAHAEMTGDAHGYVTGALALVVAVGVVVLTALGRPVPEVLTGSLFVIVGAFFGKTMSPPAPAPPPSAPARPQLVVPGHAGETGHAAD
jgi:hypothetical protein